MKKILCFGDSNTFGFVPGSGKRYDCKTRWTGVLQSLLGVGYEVIEAGCNGRTAFVDSGDVGTTGFRALPCYLKEDLDIVIVSIGLNDLQIFYQISEQDIRCGIEKYILTIRKYSPKANIIIASPSHIKTSILNSFFATMFDEVAIEKSSIFASIYAECAKMNDCYFVDLNKVTDVSDIDGLHYTEEGHLKIAQKFYELLKE